MEMLELSMDSHFEPSALHRLFVRISLERFSSPEQLLLHIQHLLTTVNLQRNSVVVKQFAHVRWQQAHVSPIDNKLRQLC